MLFIRTMQKGCSLGRPFCFPKKPAQHVPPCPGNKNNRTVQHAGPPISSDFGRLAAACPRMYWHVSGQPQLRDLLLIQAATETAPAAIVETNPLSVFTRSQVDEGVDFQIGQYVKVLEEAGSPPPSETEVSQIRSAVLSHILTNAPPAGNC
jgi:hypothetical protein